MPDAGARRVGITPRSVRAQLSRRIVSGKAREPLPEPAGKPPFRVTSEELGMPVGRRSRTLHVIGDTGGIGDPNPQKRVAAAMIADLDRHPSVGFAYHLGDIVYYAGEREQAAPQFFEPYRHYLRHIVGIPGNHDGGCPKLATFMRYFCDPTPRLEPDVEEYGRDTVNQPHCYWTLTDAHVTIVGLYTNVPEGGYVDPDQALWLIGELEAAPTDRPLIVALHHPPLSADGSHGGSEQMRNLLDNAFLEAKRCPELVLSGHAHDFQSFTREIADGRYIRYVVQGNSGYHNLYPFAQGTQPGEKLAPHITYDYGDCDHWGFLRLHAHRAGIEGIYVQIGEDGIGRPSHAFFIGTGGRESRVVGAAGRDGVHHVE